MRRADLVADCARCDALCCTATSFDISEDFALAKPAGVACVHLRQDARCAIHGELAARGFAGCAIYDCHGAGPRVTRAFAGRRGAERERDAAFLVVRVVHELLWLLTEAARLCPASSSELRAELAAEIAVLDAFADGAGCDDAALSRHERRARALLRRVGAALGGRHRPLL